LTAKNIDAALLRQMFISGTRSLEMKREQVDALNVFPVPDGDTGTNMNLTLQAVLRSLDKPGLNTCGQVAQAVASGSLMGARGNSGVILSQLFRGFAKSLERKDVITGLEFAQALAAGVETAYKAVGRPVEGTILTVAKEAAKIAQAKARSEADLAKLMRAIIEQAEKTLAKTPDLLPVLKRAGVVDAGGQGLVFIYQGFLLALLGQPLTLDTASAVETLPPVVQRDKEPFAALEIEFLYCTEFLINKPKIDEDTLRLDFEPLGDSLLVVGDSDIIKVHMHTNHPGRAMEIALQYGVLSDIKIENMMEQHAETQWVVDSITDAVPQVVPGEGKDIGVVAVAAGAGIATVLRSLGVDIVVEGGQTMNPSTEDLAAAANSLPCEKVIILPNNKNIIMAAEQVKELTKKEIAVVGSKSIPQGLAAMLSYESAEQDLDRVAKSMARRMQGVKTGQVTYAVKSYQSDVGEIKEGDIIGLNDKGIAALGQDVAEVALALLAKIVTDDDGVVSLFYGSDITEDNARALADRITELYPNCELEFFSGGQPFYYYIFAVE